ncbi:hypothetical protein Tco_0905073 [Tanacetum coccineum]
MTEPEPPKKLKKRVQVQLSVDEELARKILEEDQAKLFMNKKQERNHLEAMLETFDRDDVLKLHILVMERFPNNDPVGYDLLLWGDLKVLVDPKEDDDIWKNQQDWKMIS